MITFSLITCTYNAGHEIQRTLDSVLAQTYPAVEHLIVDGRSADDTVARAEAYRQRSAEAGNGHRVSVTSEPDDGLYDAMNKGLARATGDYVVFLNAGDVLPSADTLEHVAASVGEGERLPGVLYGLADIVDDEGRFLRHRQLQPPAVLSWRSFRHGMLRPGTGHALRPALPLLGRCGLVHPGDEAGRGRTVAAAWRGRGAGQLPRRRHDRSAPPCLAARAFPRDDPPLRLALHGGHAPVVRGAQVGRRVLRPPCRLGVCAIAA